MDIKMKTVQTTATAHVGVWSSSLELLPLSLAAMAEPPDHNNHQGNTTTTQESSFLNFELFMENIRTRGKLGCVKEIF